MERTKLTIQEASKEVYVRDQVDVVVCGGGPAGVNAAIAAARLGMKVVLIEYHGFLGGVTTAAGVNGIGAWQHDLDGRPLIAGIPLEVITRLAKIGGAELTRVEMIARSVNQKPTYREGDLGCYWIDSNPEYLKMVYDAMIEEAGVGVVFHAQATAPIMDGNTIKGVYIESKSGREAILAKVVIDCTGDGDIATRAGAEYLKGRTGDGFCQPMTQIFTLANADVKYLKYVVGAAEEELPPLARHRYKGAVQQARKNGEIVYNPNDLFCSATVLDANHPAIRSVNFTRVQRMDATNAADLSKAEILGRKQVLEAIPFMKKYVAGCEDAVLISMPPHIGIRESRRIIGEYYLTGEDIKNGKRFNDGIVRAIYCIDTHNPTEVGKSSTLLLLDQPYDIPYRCLVPKSIDNLLVAGRCISGDEIALSSYRIQSHCMAMGEAAGTASFLSVSEQKKPRDIDTDQLRNILTKNSANVGLNL